MVNKDILKAKNVIENKKKMSYMGNYFWKIYPFTTENLNGYLSLFDYSNKTILTTGSSCDQVFNLVSNGALKITHVDINPFVKYYYNLKKAAVLSLNRKNYLTFFVQDSNYSIFRKSQRTFNLRTYEKLVKYLDSESEMFWTTLFNEYDNDKVRTNLFMGDRLGKGVNAIKYNGYLIEDNYTKLKDYLMNLDINFVNENLVSFSNRNEKFDFILLSNIFDYLHHLYIKESAEIESIKFNYAVVLDCFKRLLKDDAYMFFHYFWGVEKNYIENIVGNWYKDDPNFSKILFPSTDNNCEQDGVFVYHKK